MRIVAHLVKLTDINHNQSIHHNQSQSTVTWLRIWSNSSQVEEKNGSFASLLNGTRPENSCLIIQTIICCYCFCCCCCWSQIIYHSNHLFEVERVLGSSCLLVCCCCCLNRYLWLMVVFGSFQPNRLCRGCCNQRWSA